MKCRARSLGALALAIAALVAAVIAGAGSAEAQGTTRRVAGSDRYKTIEALVREGFESSEWAVVATGESFADALSAAPLAGARRAPVILMACPALSPEAASLVRDLGVRHAYVMGGEGAVSAAAEASLASLGVACERVAGTDRQGTSLAAYGAAREAGSASDTVVVATGSNYADALAIGPWAWSSASPVLLADAAGRLSPEAVARVRSDAAVRRVLLLGGTAVVSDGVREQLGGDYAYVRLAGTDRYATAAEVARWSCENGLSWSGVAVATGTGFDDALAAAPTLGKAKAPLLLASDAATSLVREKAPSIGTVHVLGGTAAVGDAQERALADALAGKTGASGSASTSSPTGSSGGRQASRSLTYGFRPGIHSP